MKKCLFSIHADVVWCPTWSKNLGRYLRYVHCTVRLQKKGSCIYVKIICFGFEGSFWQIRKILRCEKPYFPSYISEIVNFQPPSILAHFCPLFLNKCNSLDWNITKIALNQTCELCHAPGQCFGQKIGWIKLNSGLEAMAHLAFLI